MRIQTSDDLNFMVVRNAEEGDDSNDPMNILIQREEAIGQLKEMGYTTAQIIEILNS